MSCVDSVDTVWDTVNLNIWKLILHLTFHKVQRVGNLIVELSSRAFAVAVLPAHFLEMMIPLTPFLHACAYNYACHTWCTCLYEVSTWHMKVPKCFHLMEYVTTYSFTATSGKYERAPLQVSCYPYITKQHLFHKGLPTAAPRASGCRHHKAEQG